MERDTQGEGKENTRKQKLRQACVYACTRRPVHASVCVHVVCACVCAHVGCVCAHMWCVCVRVRAHACAWAHMKETGKFLVL